MSISRRNLLIAGGAYLYAPRLLADPAKSLLSTPPGKSLVAIISEKVSAGRGDVAEARTTAVLPLRITGTVSETSARSEGSLGQMTTTTPVGSGMVKLKCELATGFTALKIWLNLSVHPA